MQDSSAWCYGSYTHVVHHMYVQRTADVAEEIDGDNTGGWRNTDGQNILSEYITQF